MNKLVIKIFAAMMIAIAINFGANAGTAPASAQKADGGVSTMGLYEECVIEGCSDEEIREVIEPPSLTSAR